MKVLGIMSGTSLDGIDLALLEVGNPSPPQSSPDPRLLQPPTWELSAFRTKPYSPDRRTRIQETMASGASRDLALLHTSLGEWFAEATLEFLSEIGVPSDSIAALGSHGQTVWHEPPRTGARGSSFQLGCPATLAERTGIDVVSDFRSRDLAAGGHGAPLVPWADRVFFSSPEGPRAIQNLGGMANVTWLPRAGDATPILAFDTGPGVALLDTAAGLATDGRKRFDEDGELSAKGQVHEGVVQRVLAHPFFRQAPPRSTGRELFGTSMANDLMAEVARDLGSELVPGRPSQGWPDVLATLTALTARSIGDAYRRWVIPRGVDEVFLMGGGSRNPALFRAIEEELSPIPLRFGEALGMDPDAREAAAFALLAWAHVTGVPANVPEATGSQGLRVLGSWTPGRRGAGP
ncbi:MAG: anhydro-N-acetylmuramic acid kinase [Gemmatimonadetes bacterium]|nr:anhydro-N-acetylmuramic acid kinase [Gemmatimonadota bacterium]NNM03833.1 anhydro-N-acetylmuramic acid kinase [Gemmatimonadota bacterium]